MRLTNLAVAAIFTVTTALAGEVTVSTSTARPLVPSVESRIVELHLTKFEKEDAVTTRIRTPRVEKFDQHMVCSGSFIDGFGDILTAGHCANKIDQIDVITSTQRHYRAVVLGLSPIHDLALIHIDLIGTPYFTPAASVQRGQRVFIIGSPLGLTDTLSEGVVARLDGDYTFLDCGALPGNSGSPVFDDNGDLVGVLTAGMVVMLGTTHLNLAQSLDVVKFFVAGTFAKIRKEAGQ